MSLSEIPCGGEGCNYAQRAGMGDYPDSCDHCKKYFWWCHWSETENFLARAGDYTKTIFAPDKFFGIVEEKNENTVISKLIMSRLVPEPNVQSRTIAHLCGKCAVKFFEDCKKQADYTILPKSSMTPFVSPKTFWNPLVLRKKEDEIIDDGETKFSVPQLSYYDLKFCHLCMKEKNHDADPGRSCCWPYSYIYDAEVQNDGKLPNRHLCWKTWIEKNKVERYYSVNWVGKNKVKCYIDVEENCADMEEKSSEIGVWI